MKNLLAIAIGLLVVPACYAQQVQGLTLQQPTIGQFGISTAVSVPDGGTMYLGGSSSSAAGSTRRRGSRSAGRGVSAAGVSVSVQLIIGSEVEAELERRGKLALARKSRPHIHGTVAEKAKAAFIAKHLGRGTR